MFFLFGSYLRKFIKKLGPTKKVGLQDFKSNFPEISRTFYLERHGQTSLKVTFVMLTSF